MHTAKSISAATGLRSRKRSFAADWNAIRQARLSEKLHTEMAAMARRYRESLLQLYPIHPLTEDYTLISFHGVELPFAPGDEARCIKEFIDVEMSEPGTPLNDAEMRERLGKGDSSDFRIGKIFSRTVAGRTIVAASFKRMIEKIGPATYRIRQLKSTGNGFPKTGRDIPGVIGLT